MFNIYVTKDTVEDNYTDGEIGTTNINIYNSKIDSTNTLNNCKEKIADYLECNIDEIEIDDINNTYIFTQLETPYGDKPSENEFAKWKENKCKLYAAHYSFTITEEKEVNLIQDIKIHQFK